MESTDAAEAFLLANSDINNFAEKENVRLNEARIEETISELTEAINKAATEILNSSI